MNVQELEIEGIQVAAAQTSEIGFLGDIVWYSCSEQRIPHEELEKKLIAEGVPSEAWPSKARPVDAFKAAVRDVANKDYLVEYETVVDPTTLQAKKNTHKMLVVRRVLDQVRDALPVGMAVEYDDKTQRLSFSAHPGMDPATAGILTREIEGNYGVYRTCYTAEDIRQMIVRALHRAYASVLKKSGGVYFVPQKYVAGLEGIAHVVESLPMAEMVATPVVDREPERKTILKRYEKATLERIGELMAQVDELVQGKERIVPSQYARFTEELGYLKEQKGKYEELLADSMATVNAQMQVLLARLTVLSTQVEE